MAVADLKSLHDEMQGVWHEMKATLEQQTSEITKQGEASGETKAKLDATNTRIDALEAQMQRAAKLHMAAGDSAQTAERKAFVDALRYGLVGLKHVDPEAAKLVKIAKPGDLEGKALSLGDDTAGGFLATPEFVQDIIKAIVLISPLRQFANVRKTSNRSVLYPVRKGVYAAKWVSETGTRSETTGLKYGMEEIPNHELYSEVLISNQDLEDSAFDMDAQLQMEATEEFAVAEGAAFINGSGIGQPEGILTNSSVTTNYVAGTDASKVVYAGLANLYYGLKSGYAANATWLMNRSSIGAIRQIVDGNQRPLWEPGFPGFSGMEPPTIFGRPYAEMPDMPNIGSNAFPIAFGDIKRGYLIVDRVTMVVQRLVEKYAEQGQIAYLVRKRVGGQVVLAEAIKVMKIATS